MSGWIDSHCHLQWLDGGVDGALSRAREAGVVGFVCVGTDLASSREAVALAGSHGDVRAAVGLHPHEASRFNEEWSELESLALDDGVVAVGETGFDFHYMHSPADAQEHSFREHVRLAKQLDLALVIHSRSAWDATFSVLADEGVPSRTVFHCFTGGPDEARRALDLGAYLSFSGIVSFPNAAEVRAAAVSTPVDRMLVETDAPYLAPVPHRGRENEPALVAVVGAALADALGRSPVEVATATASTTEAIFGPFATA